MFGRNVCIISDRNRIIYYLSDKNDSDGLSDCGASQVAYRSWYGFWEPILKSTHVMMSLYMRLCVNACDRLCKRKNWKDLNAFFSGNSLTWSGLPPQHWFVLDCSYLSCRDYVLYIQAGKKHQEHFFDVFQKRSWVGEAVLNQNKYDVWLNNFSRLCLHTDQRYWKVLYNSLKNNLSVMNRIVMAATYYTRVDRIYSFCI